MRFDDAFGDRQAQANPATIRRICLPEVAKDFRKFLRDSRPGIRDGKTDAAGLAMTISDADSRPYLRFSPSILNDEAQIDRALIEVANVI